MEKMDGKESQKGAAFLKTEKVGAESEKDVAIFPGDKILAKIESHEETIRVMDGDTVIGLFDPSGLPAPKRFKRIGKRPVKKEVTVELWSQEDPTQRPLQIWGCQLCQKTFASKSNLQIHSSIHSGERFTCETCSKCFTQKCNLKRHEAIHLGTKSFSCVRCAKKFTQKANLQRHFVIHSGNKSFSCEECGKNFIQKCNLKKHMERHADKMDFPFVECVLYEESSS